MVSVEAPANSDIANPESYTLAEAETLALQRMAEGQAVPEDLAMALQSEPPPEDARAQRMLDLMSRIAPPVRLLPLLNLIMPLSNPRIRSKAWKIYAAASVDLSWALEQLNDENARVAANVVEALWRVTPSAQSLEIFTLAAKQDRNRVAGNGLIGLINYNDESAKVLALRMARHADPAFRVTVAWAIGYVYWREGVDILRGLARDKVEAVRVKAEASLQRILMRHPSKA